MAVYELPVSTTIPYYDFDVTLDGVVFRLEFKFNERASSWFLSIFDPQDNPLRMGIKIVNDWPLLRLWSDVLERPGGEIFAVPQQGFTGQAQINQLGAEVLLTYIDAESLESVING